MCQKHQVIWSQIDSFTTELLRAFRMIMCTAECFPDSSDHRVSQGWWRTNTFQDCLEFGEMGGSFFHAHPVPSKQLFYRLEYIRNILLTCSPLNKLPVNRWMNRFTSAHTLWYLHNSVQPVTKLPQGPLELHPKDWTSAHTQANTGCESYVLMSPRTRVQRQISQLVLFPYQVSP